MRLQETEKQFHINELANRIVTGYQQGLKTCSPGLKIKMQKCNFTLLCMIKNVTRKLIDLLRRLLISVTLLTVDACPELLSMSLEV